MQGMYSECFQGTPMERDEHNETVERKQDGAAVSEVCLTALS